MRIKLIGKNVVCFYYSLLKGLLVNGNEIKEKLTTNDIYTFW